MLIRYLYGLPAPYGTLGVDRRSLALLAHDSPTSEKGRAKPVEMGGRGSRSQQGEGV